MSRRLSVLVENPDHMRKMVEKFNYIDVNHDGAISVEELQEVYSMFDPDYDPKKVVAAFEQMDQNHNGKVSMEEFLKAEGIDVSKFKAEELEKARLDEIAQEEAALAQGVAAVEIVPDGQESATCVATVEGTYADGSGVAVAAVAACVAVDGDQPVAGEAVPAAAVAVPATAMGAAI